MDPTRYPVQPVSKSPAAIHMGIHLKLNDNNLFI